MYKPNIFHIDTSKLHYVKVPANHIVIDFGHQVIDLTCALGEEVANYLVNIETDNPGFGVALFRSMFPYKYHMGITFKKKEV